MNNAPAILLIADTTLTFVAQDIEILSRAYRVDVLARTDYPSIRQFLPALLLRLCTVRYSLVYVWFAEPYDSPYIVLAARMFGVKCAIVVGGYDVACLPDFNYGALVSPASRWKVKFALRAADAVFPTSDLLAAELRQLGRIRPVRAIYLGVDCERFVPGEVRERLVVTVGRVGRTTWRLKGLDVFARASCLLPSVRFVVLGPSTDENVLRELRLAGGANLTLTERLLQPRELAAWFCRATVYAQLSVRESFGLALAEAMSAGCVPVATAAAFMPEIVGDTGFLVEYGNSMAAAEAIRWALESDSGSRARVRIQTLFSLERRERELLSNVDCLISS